MDGTGIREATAGDIPLLVSHHSRMFDEIWSGRKTAVDHARMAEIERAYARKLQEQLPAGSCKAWVIEEEGRRVIASGAVSFVSFVPTLHDPSCTVAYVHSMFTEKERRSRRCATSIIRRIIDQCRAQGVRRVLLNASEAGRPVYEKVGFRSAPDMMRLILE